MQSVRWDCWHWVSGLANRRTLFALPLLMLLILGSGTLSLAYFEALPTVGAIWWRVLGAVTMLAALGLLATVGTSMVGLVVSARSDARLARLQPYSDHFVLCGWNTKALQILEELKSDQRTANAPVVLVADLPEKPAEVPHFVRGNLTLSTMEQANLAAARAVIVLGESEDDPFSSDARAILSTHAIKSAYPGLYTCVELQDASNLPHCRSARADEIIVGGALSSALLARAARDPGVTRIVSELLRSRRGHELFLCPTPVGVVGKTFLETLVELKRDYNLLVVGIQSGEDILHTNPPGTYQIRAIDRLYIIAAERPSFAPVR